MKDLSQLPVDLKEKFDKIKHNIGAELRMEAIRNIDKAASQTGYNIPEVARDMGFTVEGNTIILFNSHPFARHLEFGTGILGPKKKFITAKRKKYLVFPKSNRYKRRTDTKMPADQVFFEGSKEWAGLIFTKYSRGIAPLRFMRSAVENIEPQIPEIIMEVLS